MCDKFGKFKRERTLQTPRLAYAVATVVGSRQHEVLRPLFGGLVSVQTDGGYSQQEAFDEMVPAQCIPGRRATCVLWYDPAAHVTPIKDSGCGYHSFKERARAESYATSWPGCRARVYPVHVFGRVVEYDLGYRSEFRVRA